MDDITKAKHMLNCHALTQGEFESSAEFVDRELRKYLALRDMGVQIDDSIHLTKLLQLQQLQRSSQSFVALLYPYTPTIHNSQFELLLRHINEE